MSLRGSRVLAIVLGLLLCSFGAAADEPFIYTGALWRLQPLPGEVDHSIQHRPLGQFLFVQDFGTARQAELLEDFQTDVVGSFSHVIGHVTLARGALLHEMANVNPQRLVFCDLQMSFVRTNWNHPPNERLCLIDINGDGVFDKVAWANQTYNDDFTPMILMRPTDVSLPYAIHSAPSARVLSAGLKIDPLGPGAYRLNFALALHDSPHWLPVQGRETAGRFRDQDIPTTLEMAGAQIEVTSIARGVVTYRVMSEFDTTRPTGIAHFPPLPD